MLERAGGAAIALKASALATGSILRNLAICWGLSGAERGGILQKIYPHIYPLWGIAFVRVFNYSGIQEDSPVGVIGW